MRVVTDLSKFDAAKHPPLVAAVGNFDGVHRAHTRLIDLLKKRARALNGVSAVVTFKEHPQRVLHKREDPPILASFEHKLELLAESGVSYCFVLDFTIHFSRLTAQEFVSKFLVDQLGAREICLGFNARFGHNRSGDSRLMRRLTKEHGIGFLEAPVFKVNRETVSSTSIRRLIQMGDLKRAAKFLGRPYSFFGHLVSGAGRGKRIGFPTVNLSIHSEVMPPQGVYAVWVRILTCSLKKLGAGVEEFQSKAVRSQLKAVLNYGVRPTFGGDTAPIPEIHFLDFTPKLNRIETMEVTFGRKLRTERRFQNVTRLKNQIRRDIRLAEAWFQRHQNKGGA